MSEKLNQSPNNPRDVDAKPAYQSLYERASNALADEPVDSSKYQQALGIKAQIEKNHPELKVDSATSMTEPSIDKAVQENAESNKDIAPKPTSTSGDDNSSSTSQPTDTSQDDTSKGDLSGDYGQNADPNATGDFTYFLKNPDAPRSMNVDDMRDRYSQDKGNDNATPTEPPDTGESDIT